MKDVKRSNKHGDDVCGAFYFGHPMKITKAKKKRESEVVDKNLRFIF